MLTFLIRPSAVLMAFLAGTAGADTPYLSLSPTYIPSFVGLGLGSYPEYLGADENVVGIAPIGRYAFDEQRYIALEVNYASINLLQDRNWRMGPAGMYRFGRKNVKDDVVEKLPDISGSLELGGFIAYEDIGQNPRDRWTVGASFLQGLTGDNEGYTISASFRRWLPIGRYSALGLYAAATYGSAEYMDTYFSITPAGSSASGLGVFDAGAGVRDIRLAAIYIQPLSRKWQIGGGVLYSRLLHDAEDSPIVADRGDADQIIFGVGFTRAF